MYLYTTFRYKRKEKYISVYYIYIHMHICNMYIHEIVYAKSKDRLWVEKETHREGKKQ